ncbi:metallophosphoesterase family protein [Anaerolineae bacterium CFX9]|jgi:diadenosine tetraphosphatase ApaH/serine/threonine PP2A family protein phosphatase|nr:metallophosphoesterase family protein [Anaerolineae bacterium CFX9]
MRILVISDIHANLTAFETVLNDAQGDWEYVWCLGDIVGYGPDPNECVELLQTMPHLCLAGNHDWAALGRLDVRNFNPDARKAVDWTRNALKPQNIDYLEALPTTFVIGHYTLAHGSPREPVWEYILEPLIAALNFSHFETPYCLVGHTHQPVIFEQVNEQGDTEAIMPAYRSRRQLNGRRQIINPGSVGQPRDANPDAAYAILDDETNIWEHRRVKYDITAVQRRMRQADMPERLIARLEHGW